MRETRDKTLVLVFAHNPVLLAGIATLIRAEPDMKLIGAVASAEAALALYVKSRPDFTLIDLDFSDSEGLHSISNIVAVDRSAKTIGLTTYELDALVLDALSAGATAVLAKDQIGDALLLLLRSRSLKP